MEHWENDLIQVEVGFGRVDCESDDGIYEVVVKYNDKNIG